MGNHPAGLGAGRKGAGRGGNCAIHQSLAIRQTTGTELWRPYCLALLAEAYGEMGQAKEGLSVLTEALDAVHRTWER